MQKNMFRSKGMAENTKTIKIVLFCPFFLSKKASICLIHALKYEYVVKIHEISFNLFEAEKQNPETL